MSGRLKAKDVVVVGYYDTYADVCTPFIALPALTAGHPDEIEIRDARAFGRELAERTPLIMQGQTDLLPACEPVDDQWIKWAAKITRGNIKTILPAFTINKKTCIKCHTCEETCPVDGFDIEAEPPRVQDPCIGCTFCVMACPTCSIEADWSEVAAYYKKNYVMYRAWLDKQAAAGAFRWYMDPDTVNFEDYMFLQHKRRLMKKKESSNIQKTEGPEKKI